MADLTYIDSYFRGELNPEETSRFEQLIADDHAFAEEVAFYCNTMQVARDLVIEEKKTRFRTIYKEIQADSLAAPAPVLKKWWPYIAAAAVIAAIVVGWQLYSKPASPQVLADNYITMHFQQLGIQMSASQDSMETAKRLYTENKLNEALPIFEALSTTGSVADEAKKLAGIVSLRIADYDKAISYFTALENIRLYTNPGKFYHALALLKRNRTGDQEMAKQLLQEVVDQKLEEKETAARWLKNF